MDGWFPAVCRVLLATVGPYERAGRQPNATAFNIFRNVVYAELKRLPQLADKKPDKVGKFLPSSVTFDAATATLTHVYRGGTQVATNLNTVNVEPFSLESKDIRRVLTKDERQHAKRDTI